MSQTAASSSSRSSTTSSKAGCLSSPIPTSFEKSAKVRIAQPRGRFAGSDRVIATGAAKPGVYTPSSSLAVEQVGDLAESAQAFGRGGEGDGIAAQDVGVGVAARAEPGDILILDRHALGPQLVDGGRQILRVPQRDALTTRPNPRQRW